MKSLISIHKEFIVFLNSLPPKKRAKLVSVLKKTHLDCLSEIFSNFLKNNLTQDREIIKKLKKYRNNIRQVALKRTPLKVKKKNLSSQSGGSILGLLLPLATSLLGHLFQK